MSKHPIKIADHFGEALKRFASPFRDKPSMASILSAFSTRAQDLETALFELLEERWIDSAVGAQLDILGRLVGVDRESLDDTAFRSAILVRIAINRSSGTAPDVFGILETTDPTNVFRYLRSATTTGRPYADFVVEAIYPATVPATNETLVAVVREAKAAGVNAQMHYLVVSSTLTFQCSSAGAIEVDASQGFADAGAPGTGGQFSGVG